MLITVTGSSTFAQPSTCGPIAIPSRISSTIAGSRSPVNPIASGASEGDGGDDGDRRERDPMPAIVRRRGVVVTTRCNSRRPSSDYARHAGDI